VKTTRKTSVVLVVYIKVNIIYTITYWPASISKICHEWPNNTVTHECGQWVTLFGHECTCTLIPHVHLFPGSSSQKSHTTFKEMLITHRLITPQFFFDRFSLMLLKSYNNASFVTNVLTKS
jgi:hypothetical protein